MSKSSGTATLTAAETFTVKNQLSLTAGTLAIGADTTLKLGRTGAAGTFSMSDGTLQKSAGTDATITRTDNTNFAFTVSGGTLNVDGLAFEYADNDAVPGEHYYYLRVRQEGPAYAWSSPIWVTVQ